MNQLISNKATKLFIILAGFFIANAIIAEFIGMKIFAVETSLGLAPLNWNLFGHTGTLNMSAGVLLWPIVFVMTDIINEYFGVKGVRMLSVLGAILITYAFLMVYWAIGLPPADWWLTSMQGQNVPDLQAAFASIFGQSNWIIVGSIIAFLVGQILDAYVFKKIRNVTGERKIWARALVSTLFSQFIDSFIVLYIAFVIGPPKWDISLFFAVGTVNYSYKAVVAILLLPIIYLVHYIIDRYLGEELSERLRENAKN
jgi:queuosine precursor transporter